MSVRGRESSFLIKNQNLSWTGTGTLASTNFTSETYQVRLVSQVAGQFSIGNSTGSDALQGSAPTTAGGNGAILPVSTSLGEYFTCRPGQIFLFSSTSTSSGTITVSECA